MSNGLWILFIFIAFIIFILYTLRRGSAYDIVNQDKKELVANINDLQQQLATLQRTYKNCQDIKYADENIFNYIRCINVPAKPVCTNSGSGASVCRSRQIDCNKFRTYVLNDPIAMFRMKLATENIDQLDKPIPPIEPS